MLWTDPKSNFKSLFWDISEIFQKNCCPFFSNQMFEKILYYLLEKGEKNEENQLLVLSFYLRNKKEIFHEFLLKYFASQIENKELYIN